MLVEAIHKGSPDKKGCEVDLISGWEERYSFILKYILFPVHFGMGRVVAINKSTTCFEKKKSAY